MNANDLASWIAIAVSLSVGALGILQTRRANTRADDAHRIAESAEARSDRLELLALERHDVEWNHQWDADTKTLVFTNVGTDTAHDVELTLDFDEQPRHHVTCAAVRPEGPIDVPLRDISEAAHIRFKANLNAGYIGTPSMGIDARLSWRTAAGAAHVKTWDQIY